MPFACAPEYSCFVFSPSDCPDPNIDLPIPRAWLNEFVYVSAQSRTLFSGDLAVFAVFHSRQAKVLPFRHDEFQLFILFGLTLGRASVLFTIHMDGKWMAQRG